jgi:hypothetical protein
MTVGNQGWVKAVIALVMAFISALTVALTGKTDIGDIDTQTWLIAIGSILASGALVAFVDNVPGVYGGAIKSLIGAAGAFISALVPAFDDRVVTQLELVTAIGAFVAALALVYQIPDPPPPNEPPVVTPTPVP